MDLRHPTARIPRTEDFSSPLHSPAVTARVGVWLGICFGVAFATGLISHYAQDTPSWLAFPTRPVSLYRVTQGLHVASGTAAIPLLLVKLWSVYPRLFLRPGKSIRELAVHGLERASIGALVAASIFQLATGLLNTAQWYPWHFHFRATHYAVGWIAIGSLVIHIAAKLPVIRAALGVPIESAVTPSAAEPAEPAGLSRRGLVRTALLSSGVVVLATAGAAVPWLRRISVFGVRSGTGPQGVPVNKSALAARVTTTARATNYRLVVTNGRRSVALRITDLEAMPQHEYELPIACVEGWSASARWTGVRMRDVLAIVGAPSHAEVRVTSLQPHGPYKVTHLPSQFAVDARTLVALRLGGQVLDLDHGYPCRLIAPDRPGVLQTKWLSRLEVVS